MNDISKIFAQKTIEGMIKQKKAADVIAQAWDASGEDAYNFGKALNKFAVKIFHQEFDNVTSHLEDFDCGTIDYQVCVLDLKSEEPYVTRNIVLVKQGRLFSKDWDGKLVEVEPSDILPMDLLFLCEFMKENFAEGDLAECGKEATI